MIPLDITPMAPIARPINYDYIGDFAKSIDQADQEKRRRQIEMLKAEMDNGIQKGQLGISQQNADTSTKNADTTAKYREMEADTHRMNTEDRKTAQGEKRIAQLRDAFRKAKTPAEKKLIMQELARSGDFTLEEVQSAAENTPGGDPTEKKGTIASGSTVPSESPTRTVQDPNDPTVSYDNKLPGAAAQRTVQDPDDPTVSYDGAIPGQGSASIGKEGVSVTPTPNPQFMAALAAEVQGSSSDATAPTAGPVLSPFPWDQFGMGSPSPAGFKPGLAGPPKPAPPPTGEMLNDFRADPTAQTGTPVDSATVDQGDLPLSMRGGPKWNPETRSFDASPGLPPPETLSREQMASPSTKGSGRFLLKDKSGAVVDIWDQNEEKNTAKSQMLAIMQPLIGGAKTPEQKAHASEAADMAAAAAEVVGPEKAALMAAEQYHKLEAESAKSATVGQGQQRIDMKRAKAGAGGGGGPSLQVRRIEDQESQQIIGRINTTYHQQAAQDNIAFAKHSLKMMDDIDNGVGDLDAFASYLKSQSGKVVTDRERGAYMNSAGFFNGMDTKVRQYTDKGRFNPEFMSNLRQIFAATLQENVKRGEDAGENAYQQAVASGMDPARAEMLRGHFTGKFASPAPRGKGPSTKPAPAGGETLEQRRARALGAIPNE